MINKPRLYADIFDEIKHKINLIEINCTNSNGLTLNARLDKIFQNIKQIKELVKLIEENQP